MINEDNIISEKVINAFSFKDYQLVIDVFEKNKVELLKDYQLIGFIVFSYFSLKQYEKALKLIEVSLKDLKLKKVDKQLDLIFFVGINCCIELNLNKKGYFLALKYLSLGGSNKDLIYATKKLKESMIAAKLKFLNKIIIWVFSICYFILYFIEFIYNVRIFSKIYTFTGVIFFILFIILYYYTKVFENILEKYYE